MYFTGGFVMNARNFWIAVPCAGQLSRQSEMSVWASPVISTIFLNNNNNNTFPPALVNNRQTTRSPGRPLILSFIRFEIKIEIPLIPDHFNNEPFYRLFTPHPRRDRSWAYYWYFHCFSVFYYECVIILNKYKILMIHLKGGLQK